MDERELARRSVAGFGEMIALLGRWGVGAGAVIRGPTLVGARIDSAGPSPWFNAGVVPFGAAPAADDAAQPFCVWSVERSVPGRVERPDLLMPATGVQLDDPGLDLAAGEVGLGEPSLAVLGEINERAYADEGVFAPLVRPLRDERVRTHGVSEGGAFVCVAISLTLGDDVCIHYVATERAHRRCGHAGRLVRAVMAGARERGARTATLQASPDGLSVYERIGFRPVAELRAFVRPG